MAKAKAKIDPTNPLHYAQGALKDQVVAIGSHDVGGLCVKIAFPAGAKVERSEGVNGDGLDEYPRETKISLAGALLAMKESGITLSKKQWLKATKQVMANNTKADDLLPAEAVEALAELNAEPVILQRRTPARRIGLALAVVTVEG